MNGATATSADCELLGRGPVQGPADSDSLAALVGQLLREQQRRDRLPLLGARRWCTVTCGRQIGLEIAPYQRAKRPDDEGFESDEDLASLGSYEDPGKRKTGTPAAAAGAVSDSANSSGASEDSADDADAASLLGEQTAAAGAIDAAGGRETYGLADVAFCHADADALPAGVAVWVIKTKRPAAAAGLEAIVVRSRDGRLQDVCRAYQELSRRLKLEPKPWTGGGSSASVRGRTFVGGVRNVTLTASPDINRRYNLVQRTDTDGVTHIEVTSGPVATAVSPSSAARGDCSPSSIISISAPGPSASGDDADGEQPRPPQRPERRKDKAKAGDSADDDGGGPRRQQRVVRGQFVRVNVVGHGAASPERRVSVVAARPPNKSGGSSSSSTASASSDNRLWSTADYDRPDHGRTPQHHSRSSSRSGGRNRSRSSGPGRRQPLQLARSPAPSPQFSRYPNEQLSSFGSRFTGKLREITTTGNAAAEQGDAQPVVTFRRRNSVGESVAANFYPYYFNQIRDQYQQEQQHHYYRRFEQQQQQQQQQQQAKNGGNLKSVIKKSNKSSQPPYGQHAYDEPKKVTFSAYATVQVVD